METANVSSTIVLTKDMRLTWRKIQTTNIMELR